MVLYTKKDKFAPRIAYVQDKKFYPSPKKLYTDMPVMPVTNSRSANEVTQSPPKNIPLPAEASQIWGEPLKRSKKLKNKVLKHLKTPQCKLLPKSLLILKSTLKVIFPSIARTFTKINAKILQQITLTTKHCMFSYKVYPNPENLTPSRMMLMVTFCKSGSNEMTQSPPKNIPLAEEASQIWGKPLKRSKKFKTKKWF